MTLTGTSASAFGQYFGSESRLRSLVRPLANVPGAGLSTGHAGYLALQRRWAGCADGGLVACRAFDRSLFAASSVYVAERLGAAARRDFLDAADTGATLILDAYGGAINAPHRADTAFPHRDARFSAQVLSYAPIPLAKSRVKRARAAIAKYGSGAYANYADPDLGNALRNYYGANLPRLRRVKEEFDPANRFRPSQGVK